MCSAVGFRASCSFLEQTSSTQQVKSRGPPRPSRATPPSLRARAPGDAGRHRARPWHPTRAAGGCRCRTGEVPEHARARDCRRRCRYQALSSSVWALCRCVSVCVCVCVCVCAAGVVPVAQGVVRGPHPRGGARTRTGQARGQPRGRQWPLAMAHLALVPFVLCGGGGHHMRATTDARRHCLPVTPARPRGGMQWRRPAGERAGSARAMRHACLPGTAHMCGSTRGTLHHVGQVRCCGMQLSCPPVGPAALVSGDSPGGESPLSSARRPPPPRRYGARAHTNAATVPTHAGYVQATCTSAAAPRRYPTQTRPVPPARPAAPAPGSRAGPWPPARKPRTGTWTCAGFSMSGAHANPLSSWKDG